MKLPFCAVCMQMDQKKLHTFDLAPGSATPIDERTLTLCDQHLQVLQNLAEGQHPVEIKPRMRTRRMPDQRGAKVRAAADKFAAQVLPEMKSAVIRGATTYGAVARHLNEADVGSRRGTRWTAATVKAVDERMGNVLF